jgi:hypothetical protein
MYVVVPLVTLSSRPVLFYQSTEPSAYCFIHLSVLVFDLCDLHHIILLE